MFLFVIYWLGSVIYIICTVWYWRRHNYPYLDAVQKMLINISARVQKTHNTEVTRKRYVTQNKAVVKYVKILSSFTMPILAWYYTINRTIQAKVHIAWHINPQAQYHPSGPLVIGLVYHTIWALICIILYSLPSPLAAVVQMWCIYVLRIFTISRCISIYIQRIIHAKIHIAWHTVVSLIFVGY
jgi:hypothetical protein